MKRVFFVALSLLFLIMGCGVRVLPEQALHQVDPSVDFDMVRADPERYRGTTLLLGGRIVENRAQQDGSVLEILKYSLDRAGRPVEIDEAGGRFLVRSDRFLDPEIYGKGQLLTLTGTVMGHGTSILDNLNYSWPLFRLGAVHVWRPVQYLDDYYRPFGYDPFWSPWYDPFWRPYSPWYRHPSYWYR